MANVNTNKGIIGILTGGGDVPGLNPAIRGVTFRALREGAGAVTADSLSVATVTGAQQLGVATPVRVAVSP